MLSMFTNEKERSQKDAGEFKPLRAVCSRRRVKKSHQNSFRLSDFCHSRNFVKSFFKDVSSTIRDLRMFSRKKDVSCRSSSLICCLRIKKKEVRRMPVKFKPLRAVCSSLASQEISSNLFRFSDFCHSRNLVKSFLECFQKKGAVRSFVVDVYEQKRKKSEGCW